MQGYETSALMISYAILMLAMHPEYQERVFEEVKLIFPDKTTDNFVHYDDLNKLEFTERVIKETMRLFPAVPVMARSATSAFDLSGCPAGSYSCRVIINFPMSFLQMAFGYRRAVPSSWAPSPLARARSRR